MMDGLGCLDINGIYSKRKGKYSARKKNIFLFNFVLGGYVQFIFFLYWVGLQALIFIIGDGSVF